MINELRLFLTDAMDATGKKTLFKEYRFGAMTTNKFLEKLRNGTDYREELKNLFWVPNWCYYKSKPNLDYATKTFFNVEDRKKRKIKALNFFYLDFDLKDASGNHYIGQELTEQKEKLYHDLQTFLPLEPDYIIESRNGFHIYYVMQEILSKITVETWEHYENGIFNYCDEYFHDFVDPQVCTPEHLMRFPGSYHLKANDTEPFQVSFRYIRNKNEKLALLSARQSTYKFKAYSKREFIDAFQIPDEKISDEVVSKAVMHSLTKANKKNDDFSKYAAIEAIADNNPFAPCFDWLKMKYKQAGKLTSKNALQIIKSIDIRDVLGIKAELEKNISSLFYTDNKPSDFFHENRGSVSYFCRADESGSPAGTFYNDIIAIIARVKFGDKPVRSKDEWTEVFEFVYKMFGFDIIGCLSADEREKEFNDATLENLFVFSTIENFFSSKKQLKYMVTVEPYYKKIIELLKEHVKNYNLPWKTAKRTISAEFLVEQMGLNKTKSNIIRAQRILQILVYCGFLTRSVSEFQNGFNAASYDYYFCLVDEAEAITKALAIKTIFPSPISSFSEKQMNEKIKTIDVETLKQEVSSQIEEYIEIQMGCF